MLIQSDSFASYGSADSLNADDNAIRQFVGVSSLTAIDSLASLFLRNSTWKPNRTGNDYTTSIIVAEYQRKNELA